MSLCSPGCPGIHSVDQAGLELRNPPASASQVLGLQGCTTTARLRNVPEMTNEGTKESMGILGPHYLAEMHGSETWTLKRLRPAARQSPGGELRRPCDSNTFHTKFVLSTKNACKMIEQRLREYPKDTLPKMSPSPWVSNKP